MAQSRSLSGFVPSASWLSPAGSGDHTAGGVFLLFITILGLLVRVYGVTGQSLWVDELMSWSAMRPGAGLHFLEQISDAIQGPLYLALTWPLLRWQDTPFSLRLVPLLAGVLTVPLLGVLAARLLGRAAGRLAALLLALSPFHVWYSQEARGYSLVMLFAVLMGLFLIRMLEDGPRPGSAFLFALFSACAVWSNMSALFLWGAMGLTMLWLRPPRSWGQLGWWAVAFGGTLVAVLPWVLKAAGIWAVDRMVVGNETGQALRGESTFSLMAVPYTVYSFFYGFSLGPSLRELHQPDRLAVIRHWWPLLAVAAVPLACGLPWGLARLRGRGRALVVWVLVPLLVLVFLAVRNVKPWNARYLAVAFPWLLLWLALGLENLPRRLGLPLTVLLVGLSLTSLGGYYWNGRYAKADVRAVAAYLDARPQVDDGSPRAILVPAVSNVFQYYYTGADTVLPLHGDTPWRDREQVDAMLDQALAGRDSVRWVQARAWHVDPGNLLAGALAARGQLTLELEVPGARLYSWQRPAPDPIPTEMIHDEP